MQPMCAPRRPPAPSRLSHINLAKLLHKLSLLAHALRGEGAQAEDVAARVRVLVGDVCAQMRARAKWWVARGALCVGCSR